MQNMYEIQKITTKLKIESAPKGKVDNAVFLTNKSYIFEKTIENFWNHKNWIQSKKNSWQKIVKFLAKKPNVVLMILLES